MPKFILETFSEFPAMTKKQVEEFIMTEVPKGLKELWISLRKDKSIDFESKVIEVTQFIDVGNIKAALDRTFNFAKELINGDNNIYANKELEELRQELIILIGWDKFLMLGRPQEVKASIDDYNWAKRRKLKE